MTTQEINSKEFNRLKGNLLELHRRIFDTTKDYPIAICAEWYVSHLDKIMSNREYKSRLTQSEIKLFIDYSIDMLRTKKLNNEDKQLLIKNIRELRKIKKVEELNTITY